MAQHIPANAAHLDRTVVAIESRQDWDSLTLSDGTYQTSGAGEYIVGDNYPHPSITLEPAPEDWAPHWHLCSHCDHTSKCYDQTCQPGIYGNVLEKCGDCRIRGQ